MLICFRWCYFVFSLALVLFGFLYFLFLLIYAFCLFALLFRIKSIKHFYCFFFLFFCFVSWVFLINSYRLPSNKILETPLNGVEWKLSGLVLCVGVQPFFHRLGVVCTCVLCANVLAVSKQTIGVDCVDVWTRARCVCMCAGWWVVVYGITQIHSHMYRCTVRIVTGAGTCAYRKLPSITACAYICFGFCAICLYGVCVYVCVMLLPSLVLLVNKIPYSMQCNERESFHQ